MTRRTAGLMRVVIIGAGIGGLVLAHGLKRLEIEVSLHDRDAQASDTGGYRLHLDAVATQIVRRHTSAATHRALLASAAGPQMFRQFTIFDHRLHPLLHLPNAASGDPLLIGRIPLRTILAHGVEDSLRFGCEFTHSVRNGDGTVTAHFADGTTECADLLVGADGARSRVTTALAGRPTAHELDVIGLAGRTPITGRLGTLIPRELATGPAFAFGPNGTAVFLSLHDPRTAVVDPADCVEVPAHPEEPYLLWGAITGPLDGGDRTTAQRHEQACQLFENWSPAMRQLVQGAETHSVTAFPYLAADPDALISWPPGPIVGLGDAVHAMPPTGGRGAATAIRDADLLTRQIGRISDGSASVSVAIGDYQRQMAAYSRVAIRESLQPLTWRRYLAHPLAYQLARRILPIGDRAVRIFSTLTGAPRPEPIAAVEHRAAR